MAKKKQSDEVIQAALDEPMPPPMPSLDDHQPTQSDVATNNRQKTLAELNREQMMHRQAATIDPSNPAHAIIEAAKRQAEDIISEARYRANIEASNIIRQAQASAKLISRK